MKQPALSTHILTAVVVFGSWSVAGAQIGPARAAVALGVLAFEGRRGESGLGLTGAAQLTVASTSNRRLAIEIGLQTLYPVSQACTLQVPGECFPKSPASPMWHARLLAGGQPVAGVPLYFVTGVGGYGNVGRADQPNAIALGLDAGVGLRLSARAAVEARYLNLRTSRYVGWAVPVTLLLGI